MNLLLDIGNSRLKWAWCDGTELLTSGAAVHAGDASEMPAVLAGITGQPTAVRIASVAGADWQPPLTAAVHERWGLEPDYAVSLPRAGRLLNGYQDYQRLGVDRWLAICAAADQFAGPLCVIDAGTALTADLVMADGQHLGGVIVPGLDLMRDSLGAQTGNLEQFSGRQRPAGHLAPGRNTAEAIACGALTAACSLIDRCVAMLAVNDKVPELIVTGGDAERLLPHLATTAHHRPLLVLEGLAIYDFAEPEA